MMFKVRLQNYTRCALVAVLGAVATTRGHAVETSPSLQDLLGVLRAELPGISAEELNRAAVAGLLDQLKGRVELVGGTNGGVSLETYSLAASRVFAGGYAYARLGVVQSGLRDELTGSLDGMAATNKLRGLVLDLRFASGSDYGAAVDAAGVFLLTEKDVLKWDGQTAHAKPLTNGFRGPVAVLINHQTSGAAEALAAVLREAGAAFLVGSPTAGQAKTFQEFALPDGRKVKIGRGTVALSNGEELPSAGLQPDLATPVLPADEERAYLKDPFAVAAAEKGVKPRASGLTRRSLNEAELVRRHKEGLDPEAPLTPVAGATPAPVLADPALARAMDFLKGVAVLKPFRAD